MKTLLLLSLLGLGLISNCLAADKAEAGPAALILKLYAAHDKQQGPLSDVASKEGLEKWFGPSLSALLMKALTKKDEPIIDFDPFYYAQDMEIKDLKAVTEVNEDDVGACVRVTFKNFDKPTTIRFHLSNDEKGWRVNNIIYATSDLRSIVSE